MAPNSELKRAVDRVTRFESQLTERLDETGQSILAKLIESEDEIESITARAFGGANWWPFSGMTLIWKSRR